MSAAIETLEQRAEDLRTKLDFQRRALVAHERGALKTAREELRSQESIEAGRKREIAEHEKALGEINAAIHALRRTRAVADRPQA